jgi:hypothetical protein
MDAVELELLVRSLLQCEDLRFAEGVDLGLHEFDLVEYFLFVFYRFGRVVFGLVRNVEGEDAFVGSF